MARPGTKQAPKAVRTIRMDDDVWLKIEERAAIESFTPSEWIRAQCLKGWRSRRTAPQHQHQRSR